MAVRLKKKKMALLTEGFAYSREPGLHGTWFISFFQWPFTNASRHPARHWVKGQMWSPSPKRLNEWGLSCDTTIMPHHTSHCLEDAKDGMQARDMSLRRDGRIRQRRTVGRWCYLCRLQLGLTWDKGQQLGGRWACDRWPTQAMRTANETMSVRSVW